MANIWRYTKLKPLLFVRASGIGSISAIGGWFVLPETARRTPAELDELFARKIKPWRFHKTKTAIQLAQEGEQELNSEL